MHSAGRVLCPEVELLPCCPIHASMWLLWKQRQEASLSSGGCVPGSLHRWPGVLPHPSRLTLTLPPRQGHCPLQGTIAPGPCSAGGR